MESEKKSSILLKKRREIASQTSAENGVTYCCKLILSARGVAVTPYVIYQSSSYLRLVIK